MPEVITISVEQKHINAAREQRALRDYQQGNPAGQSLGYWSYTCCPIAKALHEQHPSNLVTCVAKTALCNDHRQCIAKLPPEATEFIKAFDGYKEVAPFVFMVELCAPHRIV